MEYIEPTLSSDQTKADTKAVLRVLNGVMHGAEFKLPEGNTLFVAGADTLFDDENFCPSFPDNAIFIPLNIDRKPFNFEIVVDVDSNITVRPLSGSAEKERDCPLNTVMSVEALTFAIKLVGTVWPDHIFCYQSESQAASWQADTTAAKKWTVGVTILCGFVLLTVAYWLLLRPAHHEMQLRDLLQDIPDCRIAQGRDRKLYVFAYTQRSRNWVEAALIRNEMRNIANVVYIPEEKKRVEALLDKGRNTKSYQTLQLDDPSNPTLLVSSERGPSDQRERNALSRDIAALLPYADHVSIESQRDADIALEAAAGLDRLGASYLRTNLREGVVFNVEPNLDDGELQALCSFIQAFYERRGKQYVHFVIDLKDDDLKGKSFSYGKNSFVKLRSFHWYFPNPLH